MGDRIHIWGHTTDMELTIDSMQIINVNVQEAKAGDVAACKLVYQKFDDFEESIKNTLETGPKLIDILNKIDGSTRGPEGIEDD